MLLLSTRKTKMGRQTAKRSQRQNEVHTCRGQLTMIHWLTIWCEDANRTTQFPGETIKAHWPWTQNRIIDDGFTVSTRPPHAEDAIIQLEGHWCEKHQTELQ